MSSHEQVAPSALRPCSREEMSMTSSFLYSSLQILAPRLPCLHLLRLLPEGYLSTLRASGPCHWWHSHVWEPTAQCLLAGAIMSRPVVLCEWVRLCQAPWSGKILPVCSLRMNNCTRRQRVFEDSLPASPRQLPRSFECDSTRIDLRRCAQKAAIASLMCLCDPADGLRDAVG